METNVLATRRILLLAAAWLLAACQTTSIIDSWSDPSYAGGPLGKILVLGVAQDLTFRHVFEDIMVAKLNQVGVQAAPAYRYMTDGAQVPEAQLDTAVMQYGADGVLLTHLKRVDTKTRVSTMMLPGPGPVFGPYGGYYGMYSGWYAVPDVQQYDIATVETSLFATAGKKLVWTGVTETFQPTSVAQDAPGYADVIIKALQSKGLLPAK
jgi:hypothetical protein